MDKHIQISTFTYREQDVDVLVHKNKISYIFEMKGNRYGNAVEVKGKSRRATVDACFNLLLNFIETYEAASKK